MITVPATFDSARSAYFRAVRDGKATAAAHALHLAVRLGSAAEVALLVNQIQVQMGKQDLDLLPDIEWRMDAKGPRGWDNSEAALKERATVPDTATLRTILDSESVSDFRISWPSVTSHWGVSIFWADGGNEYRAFSADYTETETSRSM